MRKENARPRFWIPWGLVSLSMKWIDLEGKTPTLGGFIQAKFPVILKRHSTLSTHDFVQCGMRRGHAV
jgi:hypothetical protein